jgi:hypothetical protein
MGRFGGRIGLGEHLDTLSDIRSKWRDARRSRLVAQQAVVTSLHEAFLPAPHTGFRFAGPIGTDAIRTQQDNLSPPDVLMRRITIPCECGQAAAISGLESNGNSGSHPPDSHLSSPPGIPTRDSNVRFDPLAAAGVVEGSRCVFRPRRRMLVDLGAATTVPARAEVRGAEEKVAATKSARTSGVR